METESIEATFSATRSISDATFSATRSVSSISNNDDDSITEPLSLENYYAQLAREASNQSINEVYIYSLYFKSTIVSIIMIIIDTSYGLVIHR